MAPFLLCEQTWRGHVGSPSPATITVPYKAQSSSYETRGDMTDNKEDRRYRREKLYGDEECMRIRIPIPPVPPVLLVGPSSFPAF